MTEIVGDIWTAQGPNDVLVIPTNAGWRSDGVNPMGVGLAAQAAKRWPGLPYAYGIACRTWAKDHPGVPVHPTPFARERLLLFPTKPLDPRHPHLSWRQPSSLGLIRTGLETLARARRNGWSLDRYATDANAPKGRLLTPMLGCGAGELPEGLVEGLLQEMSPLLPELVLVKLKSSAADTGGSSWTTRAIEAVRIVAQGQAFLTTDDLWRIVEPPKEPRAMGAVMRKAVGLGYITKTDRTTNTDRQTAHRRPLAVWRSLLVDDQ